jgi:hypothetical protein
MNSRSLELRLTARSLLQVEISGRAAFFVVSHGIIPNPGETNDSNEIATGLLNFDPQCV